MKNKIVLSLLIATSLAWNTGCANQRKRTAYDTPAMDRTHNPYAADMLLAENQKIEQARLAARQRGETVEVIGAPPLVQGNRAWGRQTMVTPY